MEKLHISKKSISDLFSDMQNKKFIIPDFQRPYKWNIEKCETLWLDILNFTDTNTQPDSDYFLGTIVTYVDKSDNQKVIDGQQRITSFFLLLRAFYTKLESMGEDKYVRGLKNQLAPCIWDIEPISQEVMNKSLIHIESQVATEEDNDTFHKILETGTFTANAIDNYSKNYKFFKEACDLYAKESPLRWNNLCVTILTKCIILPIECDTPETALTIFSTLNDRGLPLADSDIFKAQLYKNQADKKKFTATWKELTHICKQANISIDDAFRYYSHVLRGRSKDKSKEVGLRKFYSEDDYKKLKEDKLIDEILQLANFWRYLNVDIQPDLEIAYNISTKAKIQLHCLNKYPNDFWKYATSVFFLKNQNNSNFDDDFVNFLKELTAFLFVKFINKPTVNAIKDDIYSTCVSIIEHNKLSYKKIDWDEEQLKKDFDNHSSSRISRALLLLDAYLHPKQKELISANFDIEHIFPKKWQNTNYNGWTFEDASSYLDKLGNKVVLEKKLNIQAGNGYFGIKKGKYAQSNISCVKDLSYLEQNDWLKEDINNREEKLKSNIINFLKEQIQK